MVVYNCLCQLSLYTITILEKLFWSTVLMLNNKKTWIFLWNLVFNILVPALKLYIHTEQNKNENFKQTEHLKIYQR